VLVVYALDDFLRAAAVANAGNPPTTATNTATHTATITATITATAALTAPHTATTHTHAAVRLTEARLQALESSFPFSTHTRQAPHTPHGSAHTPTHGHAHTPTHAHAHAPSTIAHISHTPHSTTLERGIGQRAERGPISGMQALGQGAQGLDPRALTQVPIKPSLYI
jgi:hypothetical protein